MESQKRKSITDVIYNLGAIVLLNGIIQLVLYPAMRNKIGEEAFGLTLTMLSLVSVTANSIGTAANYSRIVNERTLKPANGDYNLLLLLGGIVCAAIGVCFTVINKAASPLGTVLYAVLIILTAFRYYLDVEFRYKKNFLRFFIFYATISVGYLGGLCVFFLTGEWLTAVLTGELAGIIYSLFATSLFKDAFKPSKAFKRVASSMGLLIISEVCGNLALNADRILLYAFVDNTAVSIYYTASLVGKIIALLTIPINSLVISNLVHYDKGLSKKLWTIFVVGAAVVGAVGFGGGMVASWILLPLIAKNGYQAAMPYLIRALLAQIFYFLSGVLMVALLRFLGEKRQFAFNLAYLVEFFALTIVGTYFFGLNGFVWFSLIANALKLIFIVICGYAVKSKNSGSTSEV